MKQRIITGSLIFVAIVVAILSRFLTKYIFDAFILIISILGVVELCGVLEKNKKIVPKLIAVCYPIILYIGFLIGLFNQRPYYYFIVFYVCTILLFFIAGSIVNYFIKKETIEEMKIYNITTSYNKYVWEKGLYSLIPLIYPTMLLMSAIFINHLSDFVGMEFLLEANSIDYVSVFSSFLIIIIFVTTTFTDTFAMFVGKLVKGPKLCPKISPNKTISGAIGGIVFSLIGTLITFLIFDAICDFSTIFSAFGGQVWHIILLGVLCSIFAQIGDLLASFIKRRCGVKDYSNFLPGHGGILDRFDGLIINSLFVFVFVVLFIF